MVEYFCPFCPESPSTTWADNVGKRNVTGHVKKNHPDRWLEFQTLDVEKYRRLSIPSVATIVKAPKDEKKTRGEETTTVNAPEDATMNLKDNEGKVSVQALTPKEKEKDLESVLKRATDVNTMTNISPQESVQTNLPVFQNTNQNQSIPRQNTMDAVRPPLDMASTPDIWVEQFLTKWSFKPQFIAFQKYRTQKMGLPEGWMLEQEALSQDSGCKGNAQLMRYIRMFYEQEKQEMISQISQVPDLMMNWRPQQGQPIGGPQMGNPMGMMGMGNPMGMGGNPNAVMNPWYPQQQQMMHYPMMGGMDPMAQMMITMMQQNNQTLQTEMRAMQEEGRRRDEESRRLLEAKILQLENKPMRDPYVEKLETKIDLYEQDRIRNTQMDLEKMRSKQSEIPSPAQIQQWLKNEVQQVRTQVTAEDIKKELEKKIDIALTSQHQLTELEVEMKKNENMLQIELAKLNMEKEKENIWQKILPEGLAVLGQSIGQASNFFAKGKPGQQPGQGSEEQTGPPPAQDVLQIGCKGCGQIFGVPAGTKRVRCPACGRIMDINPQQPIQQTPQTTQQSIPQTPQQPIPQSLETTVKPPENEFTVKPPVNQPVPPTVIAPCSQCGTNVTTQNFGGQDGRKFFCLNCWDKLNPPQSSPQFPPQSQNPQSPQSPQNPIA